MQRKEISEEVSFEPEKEFSDCERDLDEDPDQHGVLDAHALDADDEGDHEAAHSADSWNYLECYHNQIKCQMWWNVIQIKLSVKFEM